MTPAGLASILERRAIWGLSLERTLPRLSPGAAPHLQLNIQIVQAKPARSGDRLGEILWITQYPGPSAGIVPLAIIALGRERTINHVYPAHDCAYGLKVFQFIGRERIASLSPMCAQVGQALAVNRLGCVD